MQSAFESVLVRIETWLEPPVFQNSPRWRHSRHWKGPGFRTQDETAEAGGANVGDMTPLPTPAGRKCCLRKTTTLPTRVEDTGLTQLQLCDPSAPSFLSRQREPGVAEGKHWHHRTPWALSGTPRDPPAFFLLHFHAAACPFFHFIPWPGSIPSLPVITTTTTSPLHHRLTFPSSPPLLWTVSIFLLFSSLSTVADSSSVEVGDIDPFSSHRLSSLPWCRGRLNGYVPSIRPLVALDWIADGLPAGRQDAHLVFSTCPPLPLPRPLHLAGVCRLSKLPSSPAPASPPLCC